MLVSAVHSYLLLTPRTASFGALATRNLTAVSAGIFILLLRLWIKARARHSSSALRVPKSRYDEFAVLFGRFVSDAAECIEEYSSGSFVGLSGFRKAL